MTIRRWCSLWSKGGGLCGFSSGSVREDRSGISALDWLCCLHRQSITGHRERATRLDIPQSGGRRKKYYYYMRESRAERSWVVHARSDMQSHNNIATVIAEIATENVNAASISGVLCYPHPQPDGRVLAEREIIYRHSGRGGAVNKRSSA